ncbi:MAG: serine hydrolase domain-containing protein [Ramlibacter sp.]
MNPPDRIGLRRVLGLAAIGCLLAFSAALPARAELRPSSEAEKALDAAAFADTGRALAERFTDVQAVVVVGGRVAYEFHRNGAPDTLRDQQSVEKSALGALVGIAIGKGQLAGVDQPVLAVVPEWAPLNPDPRAASITLRQLLTLTAGFATDEGRGPPRSMSAAEAWARPLASAPGTRFGYDNATVTLLGAILEKASGMPLPAYARQHLVEPLGMAEPAYRRNLHLRTVDAARLGQLFLRKGVWGDRQLVPADFVAAATQPQAAGGPPVGFPYGYLWWLVPPAQPGGTFMASGWAGQLVWVHPALDLAVAMNSTPSPPSQSRGHALGLLQQELVRAVERRRTQP